MRASKTAFSCEAVRRVMRERRCGWTDACRILGRRGGRAAAAKRRAAEAAEAEEQRFKAIKAKRPDLYG